MTEPARDAAADAASTADADVVSYDDVRAGVEDGDVLVFRGSAATSRIIEGVSGGVYSHAAMALWWGERLMLCQAGGDGVEAIPMRVALASYDGEADYFKLRPAARAGLDMKAFLAEAKADMGLPYSHVNLIREGAHVLLGTDAPADDESPTAFVCSQYIAHCFRKAGLPLCDKDDLDTSPTDVATSSALELMGTLVVTDKAAPRTRC